MVGRGGMQGHQLEMLTKKLNLTPDQVTQVKAIDDDTMKQASAVWNDTSLAQADKRSKMMEIHKGAQDKIRALLTDDQKSKYDALQAEMKARRQNHEGGPLPPAAVPQQ
jgi:Spy/CpxP family protein refolding chaperone